MRSCGNAGRSDSEHVENHEHLKELGGWQHARGKPAFHQPGEKNQHRSKVLGLRRPFSEEIAGL